MHRKIFFPLFMFVAAVLWSASWEVAPSRASADYSESADSTYIALSPGSDLDDLLTGEEGWFWLRRSLAFGPDDDHLLLGGSDLAWTAWLNGQKIAEAGPTPPFWGLSAPWPVVSEQPAGRTDGTLVFKVYVRRGYGALPSPVTAGSLSALRRQRALYVIKALLPAAVSVLGLLLFIGGIFAAIVRRTAWDISMAFFGLFVALASVEAALSLIPGASRYIPWVLPSAVSAAVLPLALSFWRRSVSTAGSRDPLVISLVDLLAALLLSLHAVLLTVRPGLIERLPTVFRTIEPLPWFVLWTAGAAAALWFYHTTLKRPGRIGSLIILVAGLIAPALYAAGGASPAGLVSAFLDWGLPASLLIALPVIMARGLRDAAPIVEATLAREHEETSFESDDDDIPELIGELEDLPMEPEPAPPAAFRPVSAAPDPVDDRAAGLLVRSLRSTMYPESMPYDPAWDLASARQGSRHPATGFHDVYRAPSGRLTGFSFMDAGSDSLESMVFAHLVRSDFAERFTAGVPIPRIVRSVHRRSSAAAGAAGHPMIGVLGRFRESSLSFLPMSLPPLLLRKAGGRVLTLQPAAGRASNPPLGSGSFGSSGLRTMNVTMESGDLLLCYTPSATDMRSPDGEKWGIRGLAAALKTAEGDRADHVVADIISGLKDFTGRDILDGPLQILVIRRR